MPMPHRTQMQVIKRRLVGKEGGERIKELRAILEELPGLQERPVRGPPQVGDRPDRGVARPQEGRAPRLDRRPPRGRGADRAGRPAERRQVVAAPGALEHPDQDRRLRVHDDAPRAGPHADRRRARPARRDPGPDRGRDRATAAVAGRCSASYASADAMVLCQDATAPLDGLSSVRAELEVAGIDKRAIVAVTKLDETDAGAGCRDLGTAGPAGDRRLRPRRRQPRPVSRGALAAHGPHPHLPAPPGSGGRGAERAPARSDRRRCRASGSPHPRRDVHRSAHHRPFGEIRPSARRPRPRPCRRRHGRDRVSE